MITQLLFIAFSCSGATQMAGVNNYRLNTSINTANFGSIYNSGNNEYLSGTISFNTCYANYSDDAITTLSCNTLSIDFKRYNASGNVVGNNELLTWTNLSSANLLDNGTYINMYPYQGRVYINLYIGGVNKGEKTLSLSSVVNFANIQCNLSFNTTTFDAFYTMYVLNDQSYTTGFNAGKNEVINHPTDYSLYNRTQYLNYGSQQYQSGYDLGSQTGYDNGFEDGYDYGLDSSEANFASSLFGGMATVALIPVDIFTSLFNFEILGINFSSVILSLITLSCIIFVVRLVIGSKND